MSLCDNCIHGKVCRWEVPNDTSCNDYINADLLNKSLEEKCNRVIEAVDKEDLYYCPTCKKILDLIDIDWVMNTPNDIVDCCRKCKSEVIDLKDAKQIKIYF